MSLDAVLRDLATPGGVTPLAMRPEADMIILYGVDGSSMGIHLSLSPAELADRVQEWAVEDLWSRGRPTNWPPCPQHPGSHPLEAAEAGDGRAVWRCPTDHTEVAEVGHLPIAG